MSEHRTPGEDADGIHERADLVGGHDRHATSDDEEQGRPAPRRVAPADPWHDLRDAGDPHPDEGRAQTDDGGDGAEDADGTSARLRRALRPAGRDHDIGADLVDDVIRQCSRQRSRWVRAAGGVAAALLLVAGAGMTSWVIGREAPPQAPSSTRPGPVDRRLDGTQVVDLRAFEAAVRPRVAAVRTVPSPTEDMYGTVTIVRARTTDSAVLQAARTASGASMGAVVVLLDGTDAETAERVRASLGAPSRLDVIGVTGDDDALRALSALPREFTSSVPSSARLTTFHALTRVAGGSAEAVTATLAPPAPAQTVRIRCTVDGPVLDRNVVDAAPDGVHVEIVNETTQTTTAVVRPGGDSLPNERWPALDPGRTWTAVLAAAPGWNTVTCGAGTARRATFRVADPTDSWRGRPADVGCAPAGIAGWIAGPSHGRTPREAVLAWPDLEQRPGSGPRRVDLPWGERPGHDVAPVAMLYVEAREQYWLVRRDGRPDTLVSVTRTDDGGGFEAMPVWPCAGSLGAGVTPS